ncbi:MAG TPA: hypothetical protein DIT49_06690 [Clostridiales bacterium]|nr:hypothetical protein [Clostridiales bacterium]
MLKKYFGILCLTFVLALTAIAPASAASEPQSRKNSTNTKFVFDFDILGKANTLGRPKQDASGTYVMAYTMCGGGFDVYVDGYDATTGRWVDCTDKAKGQPHLRTVNQGRLISQWVYERGYRTARLGGHRWLSDSPVTGVWSPDSSGNYPYLTPNT